MVGKGKEWEDVIGGFLHPPVNAAFNYAFLVNAGGLPAEIHSEYTPAIIVGLSV